MQLGSLPPLLSRANIKFCTYVSNCWEGIKVPFYFSLPPLRGLQEMGLTTAGHVIIIHYHLHSVVSQNVKTISTQHWIKIRYYMPHPICTVDSCNLQINS